MSISTEPGFRPIRHKEEEKDEKKPNLLKKTSGFLLEKVLDDEAIARQKYGATIRTLAEPNHKIDLDELAQRPNLKFGEGYASSIVGEINPESGDPVAPMSIEQMRLLLTRVLGRTAPQIVPLLEERFLFKYDFNANQDPEQASPGPVIEEKDDKVVVTFFRNHFITKGVTPLASPRSFETTAQRNHTWGFVDPSKVALLMGKIVANMTEPPEGWPTKKGPNITKEKVDRKEITEAIRKRATNKTDEEKVKKQVHALKQWEDFVGLALTLPNEAKTRFPDAYEHFQTQLDGFFDPGNDKEAIKKLIERQKKPEELIRDFNTTADMRSDEEKASAYPPSPERNFFDKVYRGLNTVFAPFGYKLTFEMPEDEERSKMLEEDKNRIDYLLDNYSQGARDEKFGELLATRPDFEKKGRQTARRHLVAASKDGHFAEWRVYAWLFKFSKTFREPGPGLKIGQRISEDDYKDLKMIYQLAESEGRRFGSNAMPYKQKLVRDPLSGRDEFVYEQIDREKYIEKMRQKMLIDNPRKIFDSEIGKAFEEFYPDTKDDPQKDYLAFDSTFEPSTLQKMLRLNPKNAKQAQDLSDVLKQMGVGRISADTKVLAEGYYNQYKNNNEWFRHYIGGGDGNKPIAEQAIPALNTVKYYERDLNRSVAGLDEFIQEANPEVIRSASPEVQRARLDKAEEWRQSIIKRLSTMLQFAGMTDYSGDAAVILLNSDVSDAYTLKARFSQVLDDQYRDKYGNAVDAEKRKLLIALAKPEAQQALVQLNKIVDYIEEIEPRYLDNLENLANKLKDIKGINNFNLIKNDQLTKEEYEQNFAPNGITLTSEEEKELESYANGLVHINATSVNKARAELVKRKLLTLPDKERINLVGNLVRQGVVEFRARNIMNAPSSSAFTQWLDNHPVFKDPAIASFTRTVESLISSFEAAESARKARYSDQINEAVNRLANALNAITVSTP